MIESGWIVLSQNASRPFGCSPGSAFPLITNQMMNRDFSELLQAFNANNVEYLIVGGYALASYGYVRATKDLDVWIRNDDENTRRVVKSITDFGAPLGDLTASDLMNPGTVFQIGVPPLRIDILTTIDGVDFVEAWTNRLESSFGGVPVAIISKAHLIANKKASGRLQDLADVEQLESISQS